MAGQVEAGLGFSRCELPSVRCPWAECQQHGLRPVSGVPQTVSCVALSAPLRGCSAPHVDACGPWSLWRVASCETPRIWTPFPALSTVSNCRTLEVLKWRFFPTPPCAKAVHAPQWNVENGRSAALRHRGYHENSSSPQALCALLFTGLRTRHDWGQETMQLLHVYPLSFLCTPPASMSPFPFLSPLLPFVKTSRPASPQMSWGIPRELYGHKVSTTPRCYFCPISQLGWRVWFRVSISQNILPLLQKSGNGSVTWCLSGGKLPSLSIGKT